MGGPAAIIAPPPIPEGALPDVSALSYLGFFPILLSLARSLRVRTSWLSAASVGRPTPRLLHGSVTGARGKWATKRRFPSFLQTQPGRPIYPIVISIKKRAQSLNVHVLRPNEIASRL